MTVCAWCYPGDTGGRGVSHGICEFHKSIMICELTGIVKRKSSTLEAVRVTGATATKVGFNGLQACESRLPRWGDLGVEGKASC